MACRPRLLIPQQMPFVFLRLLERTFVLDYHNNEYIMTQDAVLSRIRQNPPSAILFMNKIKIDKELLDACGDRLKALSTISVGWDHIDVDECAKRGIPIGYTPGKFVDVPDRSFRYLQ
ncbi:unnamed protein product [Rotaria sp. Silwood2]|nr:unnamed protein product [Rotaria sp. Silwood2]CAF2934923.1 unnamed protein product [Rotaria sp. Silwood2]CAF3327395.1 unnamed protein product [Rotaria sp. Silwood2]CAF3430339.1 unnamed protein product [Rotaria sp. Silwood2]CAF4401432.1 unnamed protein product [Rotaria sp. Silwood2]